MHKPLSVSELNTQIQSLIETTFINVCVEGEISNLVKHNSGHFYFSIKDKDSAIRCVLFRGNAHKVKFNLENAQKVVIRGNLSVYVPRGEYQIICVAVEPVGQGALYLAFEQLKQKFQNLGYFDVQHKKSMPLFPKKIALITSNTGAALQDMLFVAQKRWTLTKIVNFDTLVQGEEAKNNIANQIRRVDSYFGSKEAFDIIVIGRGGGSIEDLWAFNEEVVAQAIFEAKTPIVSAVGHEIDYVISDFVADLRAPTPSAAMEMILPDKTNWLLRLDELQEALNTRTIRHLNDLKRKLQEYEYFFSQYNVENKMEYNQSILKQLHQGLESGLKHCLVRKNIDFFEEQFEVVLQRFFFHKKSMLDGLMETLKARQRVIKTGFAQVLLNDKIVDLEELKQNDIIELVNETGRAIAKIEQGFTKL